VMFLNFRKKQCWFRYFCRSTLRLDQKILKKLLLIFEKYA
jgi:hypothetical protein